MAVVVGGLVVVGDSVRLVVTHPPDARWLALTCLTLLGAAAVLKTRAGLSLSLSDTFTFTVLYLLGPAPATVTASLEALGGSILLSPGQRTLRRVLFNVAAVGLAMRLAGYVFTALGNDDVVTTAAQAPLQFVPSMLVSAAVYFLANTAFVAAAVSLERGESFTDIWRTHLAHLSLSFFGGAYAALLLTLLSPTLSLTGSLLLTPIPVLLYAVFRSWNERVNDRIAFLNSTNRQYKATITALAQAVDAKDQVTHGHIQRVQTASIELAKRLRPDDTSLLQALEAASLLHDLGKIAIPEHILNKPGKLNDGEYARMKEHAAIGADILSGIDFPYPVVPIVRHHHESWDGTGYPDGLRGEAIPIGARILSVVDCFDALTSDRPYRPRMTYEEAFAILRERRGHLYDPSIVDAFVEIHRTQIADDSHSVAVAAGSPLSEERRPALRVVPHVERLDDRFFIGTGETILCLACERLKARAGVLLGYDEGSDTLRAALVCGEVPRAVRAPIKRGAGLSGWVAATGHPQLNADASLDLGYASATHSQLRTAITAPISFGATLRGVITLYGTDPFPAADMPLLELFAAVIANSSTAQAASTPA